MPARRRSLALTDGYRARNAQLARLAAAQTAGMWRAAVSREDLDGTYPAVQAAAASRVAAIQAAAAATAAGYLAAFVSSETAARPALPAQPMLAGRDEFGRSLEEALLPPAMTVKVALAQRQPPERALRAGQARAERIASTAAGWAARQALSDLMAAADEVIGWRRVTSGDACGACLGAATGAIRADDEIPEAHASCQCVAEPVIRGVRETVLRPTGDEMFHALPPDAQDALFHGRGGAMKAQLVRDGMPLERMVVRQPMELGGTVITEAPLDQLAAASS